MPNKRKPTQMKVLQGTDRPDRDYGGEPEFPVVDGSVDPPDWLSGAEAVTEWHNKIELLTGQRVLTENDLTALGHYCNLHASCVKLYRAGMDPTAAQLTQLRLFFVEFGGTPASRSKANQVGDAPGGNAFGKLKEKKSG